MDEVLNFLKKEFENKKDLNIVLGISGGPDSMALIEIFKNIRKIYKLNLICAHVHHNLREESDKEKEDLEDYCNKNNIIFEWMKIEKYGKTNLHSEGRTKRYEFFDEIIKKYNAQYLVTAHHGDDLIETVMMRIVRGSTLHGYSGFQRVTKKNDYKIIRPLLTMTKKDLIEYLEKNNIKYAIDVSNFDDEYTRNRYRKYMLPFLKKEDENVHIKFLKYSEVLQEYSEFVDKIIQKEKEEVFKNNVIDLNIFNKLDKLIQTKIIYSILDNLYKNSINLINDRHVNSIMNLINSKKVNCKTCLPKGVYFIKEYDKMLLEENKSLNSDYFEEIKDEIILPDNKLIEKIKFSDDNSNFTTRLNSKELSLPLFVRVRKSGDKMLVKKLNGKKKIKDIFIDSKISLRDRNSWPIVVDSKDNIVWLPGLKKSEFDKSKDAEYDIILRFSRRRDL